MDLRWLSLRDNQVQDLWPLGAMGRLEVLDLRNNLVRNVGPVAGEYIVDDGDAGYTEPGAGWLGNLNPVTAAFEDDYRFHPPTPSGETARRTFPNLAAGQYGAMATWLPDAARSTTAAYTVGDGDGLPGGNYAFTFRMLGGDFDGDGGLDDTDIDLLSAVISTGTNAPGYFDLDGLRAGRPGRHGRSHRGADRHAARGRDAGRQD